MKSWAWNCLIYWYRTTLNLEMLSIPDLQKTNRHTCKKYKEDEDLEMNANKKYFMPLLQDYPTKPFSSLRVSSK